MKVTESVKHDKAVLDKVRKHVQKTKQSIGGFYDLAALEKIKADKITETTLRCQNASVNN